MDGESERDQSESRWPAIAALVVAMILQWSLRNLSHRPQLQDALIGLEAVLLVFLYIANRGRAVKPKLWELHVTRALLGLVALDNLFSAFLLCSIIVRREPLYASDPAVLLGAGAAIFLTNVIIFGIWYWEDDRGGPYYRTQPPDDQTGPQYFLFTQEANWELVDIDRRWAPRFVDYLYVSLTNVVAFSPTDTPPLARRAKVLMAVQSLIAVVTLGLVFARAINILDPPAAAGR